MFNIGGTKCPHLTPYLLIIVGQCMPILSPNQIIGGTRPPGSTPMRVIVNDGAHSTKTMIGKLPVRK